MCVLWLSKCSDPNTYPILRWHTKYNMPSLFCIVSGFTKSLTHLVINTLLVVSIITASIGKARGYGSVDFFQTLPVYSLLITSLFNMALVVRVDPNGIQTLLSYDNTRDNLERNGWHLFIEKFKGFNLRVAQEFALTFDGCKAKISDVQLEVTEEFLSQATGLPAVVHKWFKNAKVEEVPWTLMFTSRKITSFDRGMPISSLKPRWHDLLAIVKQFITCEGRFRLVFLYHLCFLMSFIGFPLNMPYFLQRS